MGYTLAAREDHHKGKERAEKREGVLSKSTAGIPSGRSAFFLWTFRRGEKALHTLGSFFAQIGTFGCNFFYKNKKGRKNAARSTKEKNKTNNNVGGGKEKKGGLSAT